MMSLVNTYVDVKTPSSRVVASKWSCILFYKLWLLSVLSPLTLVFNISSLLIILYSQLILIQIKDIPFLLVRITLFILRLHIIILFVFYLPFLDLVTKIHSFLFYLFTASVSAKIEYSSRFMIHDSVQDSAIIDILPSSFHELPEFSFRDPLCVFDIIIPRKIIRHNIRIFFFAFNILNYHVFDFFHVPQKVVTYINMFGTHTNLPILC